MSSSTSGYSKLYEGIDMRVARVQIQYWWRRVCDMIVDPPNGDTYNGVPSNGALWVLGNGCDVFAGCIECIDQLAELVSPADEKLVRGAMNDYLDAVQSGEVHWQRREWVCTVRLWYWFADSE